MSAFDPAAYLTQIEKVGAVAHLMLKPDGNHSLFFWIGSLTGDCPPFGLLTHEDREAIKEELRRQVRERPDRVHAASPHGRCLEGVATPVGKAPDA